jgi:hypothetical protein
MTTDMENRPLRFTPLNGVEPDIYNDCVWVETHGWVTMADLLPMYHSPNAKYDEDGEWTVITQFGELTLQSIDVEEDN